MPWVLYHSGANVASTGRILRSQLHRAEADHIAGNQMVIYPIDGLVLPRVIGIPVYMPINAGFYAELLQNVRKRVRMMHIVKRRIMEHRNQSASQLLPLLQREPEPLAFPVEYLFVLFVKTVFVG